MNDFREALQELIRRAENESWHHLPRSSELGRVYALLVRLEFLASQESFAEAR